MSDLDEMAILVALAEAKGFRAAGERLGINCSAVSQALRRLEERLGRRRQPQASPTPLPSASL